MVHFYSHLFQNVMILKPLFTYHYIAKIRKFVYAKFHGGTMLSSAATKHGTGLKFYVQKLSE